MLYIHVKYTQITHVTVVKLIIYYMENHWIMGLHSLIIGIIIYIVMVFALGQQTVIAERRSMLMASLVFIYMILFSHRLPLRLNPI